MVFAGVVEARGHERFGCIAEALPAGELKEFYDEITRSEARHAEIFVELAQCYFDVSEVEERVAYFLEEEAALLPQLPLRAALH